MFTSGTAAVTSHETAVYHRVSTLADLTRPARQLAHRVCTRALRGAGWLRAEDKVTYAGRAAGRMTIAAVRVRTQISRQHSLDIVSFCLCLLIGDYLIPPYVCDTVCGNCGVQLCSVQKRHYTCVFFMCVRSRALVHGCMHGHIHAVLVNDMLAVDMLVNY